MNYLYTHTYTIERLDDVEIILTWRWDGDEWELVSWTCPDEDLQYLPLETPEP
jgi:hypothetical protein